MSGHHLAVIGLGTMGASLARNAASRGYSVAVYNRTTAKTEAFMEAHGEEGLDAYTNLEDLMGSLARPRKVLIMVKAGKAVDAVAESLAPYLEDGDVLIDGGNSLYEDTERRFDAWAERGIHWVGLGVSGGEEGALKGPSMMPGASDEGWEIVKPILEPMAAKDFGGNPCVGLLGPGGAGHYVKMVHNGIEYAIMQLIAETYQVLHRSGMGHAGITRQFELWAETPALDSFLFRLMVEVLKKEDEDGGALLEKIKDTAGQKGTGRWTAVEAFSLGVDASLITQAVTARVQSSQYTLRQQRSQYAQEARIETAPEVLVGLLSKALPAAVLLAYVQGFGLMRAAAEAHGWALDFGKISRLWQGGCIIRAQVLAAFAEEFEAAPETPAFDVPSVQATLAEGWHSWRILVGELARGGVASACFFAGLASVEAMTATRTSAHVLQGLRDAFGAHTYTRLDREGTFHSDWTA